METVFTIGHSNRPLPEFLGLLAAHGIDLVADVRKMPRSRANPQFNGNTLAGELEAAGIGYEQIPELAGLRSRAKSRATAANAGWRNASFHAYADYMQTAEFAEGMRQLLALAADRRVAVMCAEAVWWRCHRQLIADALVVRGVTVRHILGAGRADEHKLRDMARVSGTSVTYPEVADVPRPVSGSKKRSRSAAPLHSS